MTTLVQKQDRPISVFRDLPTGPVKHFHRDQRLVATIAIAHNEDGTFDVGVARCLNDDSPTKKQGRELAQERLKRLQLLKSTDRKALALPDLKRVRREQKKKLALTMNKEELIAFVSSNPFANGIYCEEDYYKKKSASLKIVQ